MVWSDPNILGRSLISSGNTFQKPFFKCTLSRLVKRMNSTSFPKMDGMGDS